MALEYEERARIATAEGVELELELAGIGSRGSARLIDATLQTLLIIVGGVAFGVGVDSGSLSDAAVAIIGALFAFVVFWGYDTLFEAFNSGRSPGKMRLGLRVVSETGGGLTFRMAAIRSIMRIVDEGPIFLGALLSIARSPRNQRLGDMAAGTIVVRDAPREEAASGELQLRESSWQLLDRAAGWDTSGMSADDHAAVQQFLVRRGSIPAPRRRALADALATRLRGRVHGSEPGIDSEQFLEVVAALRARRG